MSLAATDYAFTPTAFPPTAFPPSGRPRGTGTPGRHSARAAGGSHRATRRASPRRASGHRAAASPPRTLLAPSALALGALGALGAAAAVLLPGLTRIADDMAGDVSGAAGLGEGPVQAGVAPGPGTDRSTSSRTPGRTDRPDRIGRPAAAGGEPPGRTTRAEADAALAERVRARAEHHLTAVAAVQRQARQAAAAAARAAESRRPKFELPVPEKGLSALFGAVGEHWLHLHTGIDFPVQEGTPVHAATDGTVATQWNDDYGHMAMVTAPNGTQTWYCHLSGYRLTRGRVRAGQVIAYSGDTGNSTGPHLHFEVHPSGGEAVDPLPWLLDHHLDPR
jgi:murein DD-endopeptidase MepM/ murein hydrolase activator NlpD